MEDDLVLSLLAAAACGLLIGVERGWRQRARPDGTRVAGVRTFTLIGAAGGLLASIANDLSPLIAAIVAAGMMVLLVRAFGGATTSPDRQDATTMVAAVLTLLLGLLAGAGSARVAVAAAALATLVLASREQAHKLLRAVTPVELRAFALFAVIAIGVLPFLPNRELGPYDAWNPFRLWLVVVIIIGFSVVGYIASRLLGEARGILATALIGGAYSSTAVTASLSAELNGCRDGPLATGIALASAVMYLRVLVLIAILAPILFPEMGIVLGPAAAAAWLAVGISWSRERAAKASSRPDRGGKPFQFLPALGFAAVVAGAALLVRWAQQELGEVGGAWSLFLAGSFDVDAAVVTFAGLPAGAISTRLAAVALGGTVAMNMAFKTGVVIANAGIARAVDAWLPLIASLAVLIATLGFLLARL